MHQKLVHVFAHRPELLENLQMLEDELRDIEHDTSLTYNPAKKCIQHQFADDWESEYVVLRHWSDHVGAQFMLTEEPDKNGFYSAFINI